MNALDLLHQEQANNRSAYANKLKVARELEENQQQFGGTILGGNADSGSVMVQLDNGGVVPCQSITSGYLKAGGGAIVSLNGNQAWVDGMPN